MSHTETPAQRIAELDRLLGELLIEFEAAPDSENLKAAIAEVRVRRDSQVRIAQELQLLEAAKKRKSSAEHAAERDRQEAERAERRAELEKRIRATAPAIIEQVLSLTGPAAELEADLTEYRRLVHKSARELAGPAGGNRVSSAFRDPSTPIKYQLGRALNAAFNLTHLQPYGVRLDPPSDRTTIEVTTHLDRAFELAAGAIETAKTWKAAE